MVMLVSLTRKVNHGSARVTEDRVLVVHLTQPVVIVRFAPRGHRLDRRTDRDVEPEMALRKTAKIVPASHAVMVNNTDSTVSHLVADDAVGTRRHFDFNRQLR